MPQRGRFSAVPQGEKGGAFIRQSFGKRAMRGCDQPHGFRRCLLSTCLCKELGRYLFDLRRIGRSNSQLTRPAKRLAGQLLHGIDGHVDKIGLGDFINDAERERLSGLGDPSRCNKLDRCRNADQARQALGAAGAGHNAELDFGQAKLCRRGSDAIMAGQRQFQPAAESRAI
ncbi:hypothetical protein D3C73_663410 [compost metagenome]